MQILSFPLLTFWACILSAVARPILISYQEGGLQEVINTGLGANYIVWFALITASLIIRHMDLKMPGLVFGTAMVLMVYPSATLSWIAASLIAFSMVWQTHKNMAAILLLVSSLREPVTSLFMKIFAGNILGLDAVMTNVMLEFMGSASLIQSNIVIAESGQPLLILTGCSVFTNLSYNSLLWFCLHVFYDKKITLFSWIILALTILLTLASNALRLALMTKSEAAYLYYHDGLGSQIFEWGLLFVVLLCVIGGCRYAKQT